MPELPEVEIIGRGLGHAITGWRFTNIDVRRPDLRIPIEPDFGERLKGRLVTHVDRRGKYLLIHCDNETVVLVHLGMAGQLLIGAVEEYRSRVHDHIRLQTENGFQITFHDPRRFGFVLVTTEDHLSAHPRLRHLGPEPLDHHFTTSYLLGVFVGRKRRIKSMLLDQTVIAGLGNIYVCEALFYAGICPRRSVSTLGVDEVERLVQAIRSVLRAALHAGGTTIKDYVQSSGQRGYFQNQLAVYGRTHHPCPGCHCDSMYTGGILRFVQSGRSTYYCPHRQH